MKKNFIIYASTFLFLVILLAGCLCGSNKNNISMNQEKIQPQTNDSGRLLTLANLEQTDSGRRVVAWFFETPQIFEFNLDNDEARTMLNTLTEAKTTQTPVNVLAAFSNGKNMITRVLPPSETQLAAYKKKTATDTPKKVPPPGGQ